MSEVKRYTLETFFGGDCIAHEMVDWNGLAVVAGDDYVLAVEHDAAIAAKDARIASMEGLLREVTTSGYSTGLRKRIDEALAANRLETLNESETVSLEDMESRFGVEPATHSEEGREVPEVTVCKVPSCERSYGFGYVDGSCHVDLRKYRNHLEDILDSLPNDEPLMTVAQHERIVKALELTISESDYAYDSDRAEWNRIVAAKDAEIARLNGELSYFPPTIRALAETISELRAQPARQVGGERTYEQGIQAAFDLIKLAACNTSDDKYSERLDDLAEDIIEEAPTYKAHWKDINKLCAEIAELKKAALAPAAVAVVMPVRKAAGQFDDSDDRAEIRGWNAALEDLARLNRCAIPAGLIEKAANLLDAHMCTGCAESEICCRPEVRDTARELRALLGKS